MEDLPQHRLCYTDDDIVATNTKVSFGNSKETVVETFTYDRSQCVQDEANESNRSGDDVSPLTPSKVRVTVLESKSPSQILPPFLISDEVANGSVVHTDVTSSQSIPVLNSRMTEVEENPFRPDGNLCHEVDPIVESYRRRPYPTELDNLAASDFVDKLAESKVNDTDVAKKPTQITLSVANGDKPETKLVEQKTVPSPKAGTVEVVHLKPKKRSCRCCAVQ